MRLVKEQLNEGDFTRGGDPYKKLGIGSHSDPLYKYWEVAKESLFFREVSDIYLGQGYEGKVSQFDIVSFLNFESLAQDKKNTIDTWSVVCDPHGDGGEIQIWYNNDIEAGCDNVEDFKSRTASWVGGDTLPDYFNKTDWY